MVVFLQSLERAEPDSMIENRLENIINQLTQDCYNYMRRGIFETHKLMPSLQMTLHPGRRGHARHQRARLLPQGRLLEKCKDPSPADFISDAGWHDMQRVVRPARRSARSRT